MTYNKLFVFKVYNLIRFDMYILGSHHHYYNKRTRHPQNFLCLPRDPPPPQVATGLFSVTRLVCISSLFKKDLIYLFLERGEGREKRGRETPVCSCLSHAPYWGPGPQPRHVPQLGIEPVTPWFSGRHSIH